MNNLVKISLVPMDYEERKKQLIESIVNYLNFDSVSLVVEWHNPKSDERQAKVRKDAENIAEIALDYYKLNL